MSEPHHATGHLHRPLLEVSNLRVSFHTPEGVVGAVQNVSFSIQRGRTLALVGESGAGKSVTASSLLRLVPSPGRIVGGRILLRSQREGDIDIAQLDEKSGLLYRVRGGLVGMIFQEPMTALSPVHRVGSQVAEAILTHRDVSSAAARRLTLEMFAKVGIAEAAARYEQYPHELSGGLRQRVIIAMALVCQPELLIADEPTTALDVTTQAQILGLIKNLQQELGCAVLLITHDFGVVAQMADDVAVMQGGAIVERGPVRVVLKAPQHAHTCALLDALRSRRAPVPREGRGQGISATGQSPMVGVTTVGPRRSFRVTQPATPPLLSVRGLTKHFPMPNRGFFRPPVGVVRAVEDVSFELAAGESFGLVGESGCGKTTAMRCLLRALVPTAGEVKFRLPDGRTVDLTRLSERELKPLRPYAQMIFQDPMSSLNPRMTVRDLVGEPLVIHNRAKGSELDDQVCDMLRRVGLDPAQRSCYPHAFSGGQRQRIAIARALVLRPSLVVCDEATSALDLSVQAQVLELLGELQREVGLTYIFVAHNLDVVRHFCDRVAVMRRGRIVELASAAQIFSAPQHPYTRLLLSALLSSDPDVPMNAQIDRELAKLDTITL